jgi:hypothetical protein
LSPWIEGGKFCGSRGMALPLLGLNVRLKGDAAKTHECTYFASFVDGSSVGPVPAGEACQADSLAALEAFQIVLRGRGASAPEPTRHQPAHLEPTRPARPKGAAPVPQPAATRTTPADKPVAPPANRGAARTTQRATPKRPR